MPRQAIQIDKAEHLQAGDHIVWHGGEGSVWLVVSNDKKLIAFRDITFPALSTGVWHHRAAGLFEAWSDLGRSWEVQRA